MYVRMYITEGSKVEGLGLKYLRRRSQEAGGKLGIWGFWGRMRPPTYCVRHSPHLCSPLPHLNENSAVWYLIRSIRTYLL
jgi:hypothetical protein